MKVKGFKFFWRILCVVGLIMVSPGLLTARAEELTKAEIILQSMTAEEKIGQLFLVSFEGATFDEDSAIYDLISNYHVGGVLLTAENNNFPAEDIPTSTQGLIRKLQELAWESSSEVFQVEDTGRTVDREYVPLLVGLQQLGNGFPGDQILSGLTNMPSQLAVGASWDLDLASQAGNALGYELSLLGFNLYLGPNLDIIETVNNEAAASLGVNTFGGNPFWVGEMGKAFISGLHIGSNNRMLVAARNFPGTGNADRSPEEEVSTVRKSLDQLKQVELVPYQAVTAPDLGNPSRVDALIVSHNRYQGLQGNIRANTRPISFDTNALQMVMALPEFDEWHENWGLIISDNLGSEAVRRFFDPNDNSFEARQIARNAFLAGNDLLIVDNFIGNGDPDAYTTIKGTIDSFVQKYREDSAFARRVDSSVLRILEAKLAIYGEFSISRVIGSLGDIETLGEYAEVAADIAQAAVTLISPSAQELDGLLESPPQWNENMVIFTDVRPAFQCEECPPVPGISTNAFADALVSLYGPQAGGQILQSRLNSFSFSQLVEFLDNLETETAELIPPTLRAANWVIFNTIDLSERYPASNALKRVLAERPELLAGKNVIVFTMGSPGYLDATDISRVTAYYGLYSHTPAFLDVAARVLMQEYVPSGALPISLSSVGYDLNQVTLPNPNQVIRLELVLPEVDDPPSDDEDDLLEETADPTPQVTPTPEPTPLPVFNVGDTITIRTSQIVDHNQNIVPDGTIVRFNFRIAGEPGVTQLFEAPTTGGLASFLYRIEAAGGVDITANSGPATQSETLQINISPEGLTSVFAFTPTPEEPSTPTLTPTETLTPTPTITPTSTPEPLPSVSYPTLGDWAFGILVMGLGGGLTFFVGLLWWGTIRWGLRSALCTMIGGLLSYSYLNIGIEGVQNWIEQSGRVFVVEVVIAGLLLGWIAALIWWLRTEGRFPSTRRAVGK